MDLEAIRKFVQDHPDGVVLRMIDGTKYKIPHRDYISFGAPKKTLSGKEIVTGTSFILYETGEVASMRLLNAMLVAEVLPLGKNGSSSKGKRRKSA